MDDIRFMLAAAGGTPTGPGRPEASDEDLAAWVEASYPIGHVVGDLADVDELAAAAACALEEHGAAHLISLVEVRPLRDDGALITVDLPGGLRPCSPPVEGQAFEGCTVRDALARLLGIARAAIAPLRAPAREPGLPQADLDALAAAAQGLAGEGLDDLVHDAASEQASEANNAGPVAQAAFLARHLGTAAALAILADARHGTPRRGAE